MASKRFWRGFGWGAASGSAAGVAVFLLINNLGRKKRIVRLEKSLQIGAPVEEVFRTWSDFERLPLLSDYIQEVRREGRRTYWKVRLDGRTFTWEAELEQFIPNLALGWKSLRGPKHSGRITFSPIGDDTLLQLTMNYAPPLRLLKPFVQPISGRLDDYIERVLRDFKAALEGKGQEGRRPAIRSQSEKIGPGTEMTRSDIARATGTHGMAQETESPLQEAPSPVEYTRPPEAKS